MKRRNHRHGGDLQIASSVGQYLYLLATVTCQDAKRSIRRLIEKKDADLINRRCSMMDAIEALLRNAKRPTMEFEHPTMRKDEKTKPPEQNDVLMTKHKSKNSLTKEAFIFSYPWWLTTIR